MAAAGRACGSSRHQPSNVHSFIPHSPRVGDGGYIPRIPRMRCGGWLHGWGGWARWGGVRQCMGLVVGCTHDPRAARGRARGAARKSTTQLNYNVRSSMQDVQDHKSRTAELAYCCSCRPRNWLCSPQTAQTEWYMHGRRNYGLAANSSPWFLKRRLIQTDVTQQSVQ